MLTVESAAWCLGCGDLGAEMGGLCGSAQPATPSPGAPLQAPHLQRSPIRSPLQVLAREAGAQKPGVGQSPQVGWGKEELWRKRREKCSCPCSSEPHSLKMILSPWKNSMVTRKYILKYTFRYEKQNTELDVWYITIGGKIRGERKIFVCTYECIGYFWKGM